MEPVKDRQLDAPEEEANRGKHINFLAIENGDIDPADEDDSNDSEEDENGFFTDEDNMLETKEEKQNENSGDVKDEKVTPLSPSTTETLADKITVDGMNEDLLTQVTDDNPDSYTNKK